jgi:ATP-dependent helicase/nuclease subunit B
LCDLPRVTRFIESPHGEVRFRAALEWLSSLERHRPLLIVAHSLEAARDLLRAATLAEHATFGWALESLTSLAMRLAALPLAERRLSIATPLALEAVAVRVVSELGAAGKLGRFEHVADRPGLPRALLRTFTDLALADVDLGRLEAESPELAVAFEHYRRTLAELRLADRATVLEQAIAAVATRAAAGELEAVCLYDLAPKTKLERTLVEALAANAGRSIQTCASGEAWSSPDASSLPPSSSAPVDGASSALWRLQAQLFTSSERSGPNDGSVSILSAPGESRECVEIARRVLQEAERGVPFDRMAILLRSPFHYRTHLLEALRRASIPAYFTRGAVRPEPGGRALLVLLRCAAEGVSAVRFAEYLSLGVAPLGGPEPARSTEARPVDDATAALLRPAQGATAEEDPATAEPGRDPEFVAFPRRWESLLVDAAVVGGVERWRRRLSGLEEELSRKAAQSDDSARVRRDLAALRALAAFALPLVERLGALPARARFGEWLTALRELVEHAIARPEVVLGVLDELEIVRDVGPISLSEVRAVLEERLGEIQVPPVAPRGGAVLVASVEEARGRVFDTVFVPGLAEKLFPQRVVEDPLLSDRSRLNISEHLETQAGRVHAERQALRIAVGCARRRLVLSYPRFESDKARPRVPSFYALEALRAAEGTLPGFGELARRADAESQTRMGWPAPKDPNDAIDAAEYDLATLHVFLTGQKDEVEGAVRYLVTEHRILGRALQARARRWRPEWRNVDGLVDPSPEAREALDARYGKLRERGFSVTALERYAVCPYRFYLATVVGLRPRETASQVEELEPATRGLLFHEIVHRAAEELTERDLLAPEADPKLAEAIVDQVIARVADDYREKLAPAIDRVWQDAIGDLRLDVHAWLRELRRGEWRPVAFELPFGLPPDENPEEGAEPVVLDSGLSLRGRIDAVEERGGELRATDYKTGEAPPLTSAIIAGGTELQPALYALVLEKLFPNNRITGGNAYYCTARGEFARRHVELSELTREAASQVHEAITRAFSEGFFPAAPAKDACNACEYRVVCGPYEEERVRKKRAERLETLKALRETR